MSLEIIEYNASNVSESELLTIIKQRTGLELEKLASTGSDSDKFNMRFPDMETAQSINLLSLYTNGTFFIDADNHFLCYSIESGLSNYTYVDELYKALVFDYNGKLVNICYTSDMRGGIAMNASLTSGSSGYAEDDTSKSNITLVPLRASASDGIGDIKKVQAFVKNCYVNYERKFQRSLKFIDQNGNRFVTLGGYLLYKID